MVNKERVQLFVDALRSGEYQQGRHALATVEPDGIKYCCLGVACEVAINNGLPLRKVEGLEVIGGKDHRRVVYDGEAGILPEEVAQWYGFNSLNPHLYFAPPVPPMVASTYEPTTNATAMNDSGGYDFNTIADSFERTYLLGADNGA